ncbi:DNA polymerase III subunit gamma/tau [Saccharococcus caldoxylosilyticus]|uniref:DNA-directed DNA polymerase n=2 Tax=Saccharococcus caldoxylosilyticus TaxID=81408 RepID=A0A023DKR2_9BACL|nr:DNA polymerase III subunit gamma/tau [Parageobacillus caldoxylosilyticus]OQP00646.1 DNA polymerase III subunit gamma/tau [Geobacillus sp. 44B]KYD11738.1 DNA polymerase III subunits gamma and tau [Parageobacillus caldoxylosilyticus]MBB3854494.1 DNA polymerase-3 subunit gamma/tau [Parageobacillus caldoxylosilyticus]QNU38669.1 DNA polymerase III subunit gamma/tau [Geobacillus sp. 44B]QXJ38423.1 DNA polymerase III subunit tau [Parageobacillus caldoxylosilyticus]
MTYQALYRVFRPQRFADVVGQEHVTKTLQSALLQNKISHAYLFSGPRGTGKTSAAKIFAKAVNCEHAPTAEPCNECPACIGITNGTIPDVLEIDAASNNRVDEIRDIRDKVKFAPTSVRYKVYIIDEVHMLSIGAFNALLKTLEEPPKHVIFILATTEPHKIPLTIISRCQRFDFRRIPLPSIVARLRHVVSQQGIKAADEALSAIARAADGGMRDALSLLDQAISFSDGQLLLEDVLAMTGAVSSATLASLAQAIYEKDTAAVLQLLENMMDQGKDPNRLIEDLIFYYRDLLLYKTAPHVEGAIKGAIVDDAFKHLAEAVPVSDLYETIEVLNKSQQEMKWTNHPRIFLEVALVKLCHPQASHALPPSEELQSLIKRVEYLEAELRRMKEQNVAAATATAAPAKRQTKGLKTGGYKTPVGRIYEILKQATHQDLALIKSHWAEMLDTLKKQHKVSHAALLQESEPVAASPTAFVLKFKYEIHCKMAADNTNYVKDNLEAILFELTKKRFEMVAVPEEEWGRIREEFIRGKEAKQEQEEEDPLIAEAKRLFGEELIEIKE